MEEFQVKAPDDAQALPRIMYIHPRKIEPLPGVKQPRPLNTIPKNVNPAPEVVSDVF